VPSSWVRWLALRIPASVLDNPWGVCMKASASIAGLLMLFWPKVPLPITIRSELGPYTGRLWAMLLAAGGLLGLFGYLKHHWRLEVAGLLFLATAAVVYGVVLLVGFGGAGIAAGFGFLGVCVAALLRSLTVSSAAMVGANHIEPDKGG
jgi:hypothetical protein